MAPDFDGSSVTPDVLVLFAKFTAFLVISIFRVLIFPWQLEQYVNLQEMIYVALFQRRTRRSLPYDTLYPVQPCI